MQERERERREADSGSHVKCEELEQPQIASCHSKRKLGSKSKSADCLWGEKKAR
jgi:hypothetical protein